MHKVLKSFQLLLVFLLLLGISCSLENNPDGVETAPLLMTNRSFTNPDGGGIALTFDDAYIAQWYAIKDLLQQYSARATFFVSHFLSLSAEQVQQLRELKAAGNEIGFHGVNHIHAVMYLNAGHTITEYLNAEIFPGITAMRNAGLFPTSFAYPYGENNLILNSVLLHHFDYIRDTSYTSGSTQIADLNACYYSGGNQRSLAGIGIDTNYGHPLSEIYTGMDRAAQNEEVLIFYSHEPTNDSGDYNLPLAKLESILQYAAQSGLDFYGITQLQSWKISLSGTGTWQVHNYSALGPNQMGLGDFDGDGATDVLWTTGKEWRISPGGSGEWEYLNTSGCTLANLGFGDFDGNGRTDILRTGGGHWYVSWNGTTKWQSLNTSGYTLPNLGFGDFDGNGTTDILRTSGSRWYVSWSGTSRWQRLNTSGYTLSNLGFGDFDGNGTTDILRTSGSRWYVSWSGTSQWQRLNTSGYTLSSLGFGDFDGNGRTDILCTGGGRWNVSWNGSSRWQRLNVSNFTLPNLELGDFDGNGTTDILSTNRR